ncbi:hypothetical protein Pcinc_015308 [Petrolisthes cinctipes]|uniref:Uncharacterized protein n=1 Tax=Petrolisthes cinctipes TaxID=88211 RepID=A0AAE1KQV1_PETCI|nr:hypothetical protein Pcinc_015308 [Petrolisthes cinctipes]
MFDWSGEPLTLDKIDYGGKFTHELNIFLKNHNNSAETVGKAGNVKVRCAVFLTEALQQVDKRLPVSTAIYKGLQALAPSKVLSQTERVSFKDLPLPHLIEEKDMTEQQYRKILHVSWMEESVFDGKIPTDYAAFWSGVIKYKTSTGTQSFKELGYYALACLTTPTSNAVVESSLQ